MKNDQIATRVVAGVLPAMALFATPVLAQDVPQPTPPATPPVVQTAPPAVAAPTPAPAAQAGPSDADRAKYEASVSAATGTAAAAPDAQTTPATAAQPAARRATPARSVAPVANAPRAAAPIASTQPAAPTAATPAPVATFEPAAPLAASNPGAAPVTEAPAPATAETTTTRESTTVGGLPFWGWVVGGIVALALAAAGWMAARRRREDEVWIDEPVAHEEAVAAPPLAEPTAEHVEIVAPAADDVAAITDAATPVAGRPWIELSLRPVRAGATDESATVDLELTLANAGEVAARDVRVSTFMLGDAGTASTELERLLATPHDDHLVSAGEIGAGAGSRVDATLAIPREGLEGATFRPLVVADVRYALPDGGEGRTAAAFAVGGDDGSDVPTPLRLGGDMREDVAAALHGLPERA